jgi:hypothetical protein
MKGAKSHISSVREGSLTNPLIRILSNRRGFPMISKGQLKFDFYCRKDRKEILGKTRPTWDLTKSCK